MCCIFYERFFFMFISRTHFAYHLKLSESLYIKSKKASFYKRNLSVIHSADNFLDFLLFSMILIVFFFHVFICFIFDWTLKSDNRLALLFFKCFLIKNFKVNNISFSLSFLSSPSLSFYIFCIYCTNIYCFKMFIFRVHIQL